jgi:hypothetical protein
MTTAVHVYTSHIAPDRQLQLVAFEKGPDGQPHQEMMLNADLYPHTIVTHYVHSGRYLVVREIDRAKEVTE